MNLYKAKFNGIYHCTIIAETFSEAAAKIPITEKYGEPSYIELTGKEIENGVFSSINETIRYADNKAGVERPIGFDSEKVIYPGEEEKLDQTSKFQFRTNRIIIPESVAKHFTIQLHVDGKDQLRAEIPAILFSQETADIKISCSSGILHCMTVKNISDEPQQFMGAIIGMSLEMPVNFNELLMNSDC